MNPTTVTKTITINASPSKVWNTVTNPELIPLWMLDTEIISDWQVGSPIIFKSDVNGSHVFKGNILQLEREKIFQYTSWSSISKLPDEPENYSLIEFRLTAEKNQTILTLTHSNLIAEAAVPHANFFWGSTLVMIKKGTEE